ncbi:MAG: hypothetical protein LWX01_11380 [Deltaproteobacteria bacterium]|nr:hypothetical protein [Deltaproteobacteria bacterium]MDL1962274.1 hypothetical protein [Deltaproteobacteria bacterium]
MIKHMGRILIIISVVFVLPGIASGTEFTQRFNAKEDFTLKLPYNWVQIPGEVLDEHSRKLQQAAPDAEKLVYDYGFQLSGAGYWLACPYILICLNKTGRIPEGKMKKLTKEKKGSKPIEERISGIPDTEVGEILYDLDDHTLWMTFLADAEKIKGLIATKLTREGCIQIVCYAEDQDFNEYRKLFEDIVKNICISEDLEYKPRITDSIPIISQINFDKALPRLFSGVIVIALIWLLLNRGKRSPKGHKR